MHRALMVRRWNPADRERITELFAEHDRTALPAQIGATRRTLFGFHDLYFHLIEGEDGFQQRLYTAVRDQRFKTIDGELAKLLLPYRTDEPSMAQAQAEAFYDWRRPL
ncbi:TcmI family type II polyketide cyclase [Amycolatopsis sp. QT-25]|uniref:TcmI family type II polyketide cyclase n=1 Tax=Amycolatopsis sp. QT-25 TaxID=3034022 RepID=UPI0023EC2D8B|nr:TcmI family type II polyketide cyclase [Amycolatopsis sp. QT-25]WET76812.1 TcmI family type II polyketide cyclase [Amycolatopsis sp. QT-25]